MLTRQQAVEHRTFSDSVAAYVSFAFGPAPLSSSKIFGTPIPNAEQVSHSRAISIDFDRFRPISTDFDRLGPRGMSIRQNALFD